MWLFQLEVCFCILNIVTCDPHCNPGHPELCTTESPPTTKTPGTLLPTTTATTTTKTTSIKASTTLLQTTNTTTTTTEIRTKTTTIKIVSKTQGSSLSVPTLNPDLNRKTNSTTANDFEGIIAGTVLATVVLITGGILVVFLIRKRGSNCFRSKQCASTSNCRQHQNEIDLPTSGNNARNSGDEKTNHKYTYIDTNPEHVTENNNFSYELAKPIIHQSEYEKETKGAIGQYFILEKQSGNELSKTNEETYTRTLTSEYDHLHGKTERKQNKLEQQNIYAHAQHIDSGDKEYDVTSYKMSKDNIGSGMYHHTGILGGKVCENNDPYDHCSC